MNCLGVEGLGVVEGGLVWGGLLAEGGRWVWWNLSTWLGVICCGGEERVGLNTSLGMLKPESDHCWWDD